MSESIKAVSDKVFFNTYGRYPLTLVKGSGATVWDDEGRAYTDFVAGVAVCSLGHAHPRLTAVLSDQAGILWHVSNLFYTEPQTRLADWLTRHSFADRVFLANSGAESQRGGHQAGAQILQGKG